MSIQGYVDQITHSKVIGWAINWDQPTTPVEVSIVVDGTEVARCRADIMRERLKSALGDGATGNAHGLNERIRVQTLIEGREFLYRLTKMYAGGK